MWRECQESLELRKERGKHSEVYLIKKYAIKIFKEKYKYNFLKEVKFLRLLQPFRFVPEIYYVDFDQLRIVMKRIEGRRISELIDVNVVRQCIDYCFILDVMKIQKEEMNHPDKHILIANRVYFIDFERGRFKDRPSNLTQFCNYLRRRGVELDKRLMIEYKRNPNAEIFGKIKSSILREFN